MINKISGNNPAILDEDDKTVEKYFDWVLPNVMEYPLEASDYKAVFDLFDMSEDAKNAFEKAKREIDDKAEWLRPGYSEGVNTIKTEVLEDGAYVKTGYYPNGAVGLILSVHLTPITNGTTLFPIN